MNCSYCYFSFFFKFNNSDGFKNVRKIEIPEAGCSVFGNQLGDKFAFRSDRYIILFSITLSGCLNEYLLNQYNWYWTNGTNSSDVHRITVWNWPKLHTSSGPNVSIHNMDSGEMTSRTTNSPSTKAIKYFCALFPVAFKENYIVKRWRWVRHEIIHKQWKLS